MLGGGDPDCLSASEFRRSYLGQQAVLISGLTNGWAAAERWQPAEMARRYGEVPVRLMTDVQKVTRPAPHFLCKKMETKSPPIFCRRRRNFFPAPLGPA